MKVESVENMCVMSESVENMCVMSESVSVIEFEDQMERNKWNLQEHS